MLYRPVVGSSTVATVARAKAAAREAARRKRVCLVRDVGVTGACRGGDRLVGSLREPKAFHLVPFTAGIIGLMQGRIRKF